MAKDKTMILVAGELSRQNRLIEEACAQFGLYAAIRHAEDGQSCRELLESNRFDIAFIDLDLAQISGLEAIALARKTRFETLTVLMSERVTKEQRAFAQDLAVYDILRAPACAVQIKDLILKFTLFSSVHKALVIDDSQAVRNIINKVLLASSFNLMIEDAPSFPDALTLYQRRRHDLVFIDVNVHNYELHDIDDMLIKVNPDVKIAFMAAKRESELELLTAARDNHELLYKPFYPHDIDHTLHQLFDLTDPHQDLASASIAVSPALSHIQQNAAPASLQSSSSLISSVEPVQERPQAGALSGPQKSGDAEIDEVVEL